MSLPPPPESPAPRPLDTSARLVFRLKRLTGLIRLKKILTRLDASSTHRPTTLQFETKPFRVYRTFFFNEADQSWFDPEILPYFAALPAGRTFKCIVDAGASSGMFSLASSLRWPDAEIHAFEPSERQRLLLARNIALNPGARVAIEPFGLWSDDTTLKFKSVGAISSVAGTETLPDFVTYDEEIRTRSLDHWAHSKKIGPVDLIKMDVEGSELEALHGARGLLADHRPLLLVQAYHVREGDRTFDRCAAYLENLDYDCREMGTSGLLVASPRP